MLIARFQLIQIRAVADNREPRFALDIFIRHEGVEQRVQILLSRYAADVRKNNSVAHAMNLVKLVIAMLRIEKVQIRAARKNEHSRRIEPMIGQLIAIKCRR